MPLTLLRTVVRINTDDRIFLYDRAYVSTR